MSGPSSTAFVRPDLGQSFEEFSFEAERQGFIGTRVYPVFDCALKAGNFSRLPIEQLLKTGETKRAPGAGYNRDKFQFEQDSFACVEHGAEEPIDDNEKATYAYTIDYDMVASGRAMNKVLRNLEIEIAASLFNATVWTGATLTTAVGTEWSTASSCTPIDNVLDALQKVRESSTMMPNAVVMTWKVFKNIKKSDQIMDQVKYSGIDDPKKVTTQMLAALFEVEEVIVAGAMQNSATEGQTASLADIWDDEYVSVARLARSNDLRETCVGRTFHFTGDGSSPGVTMESYRDESVRSEIMRGRMDRQVKRLHPEAAHLLSNITA